MVAELCVCPASIAAATTPFTNILLLFGRFVFSINMPPAVRVQLIDALADIEYGYPQLIFLCLISSDNLLSQACIVHVGMVQRCLFCNRPNAIGHDERFRGLGFRV